MAGLIGIGRLQSESAIKGMAQGALLERYRDQSNKQLKAASDARTTSAFSSGAGGAIALGPKAYSAYQAYTAVPTSMEAGAGQAALQEVAGAQTAGGSLLADGTVASADAVTAAAPTAATESVATTAATEAATTAATEAAATTASETAATALAEGTTLAATEAAATGAAAAGTEAAAGGAMAAAGPVGWVVGAGAAIYALGSALDWW